MSSPDPWIAQRLHAENRLRRHEIRATEAVLTAMTLWLDTARALVLHQPIPQAARDLLDSPLTAAAGDPTPDIDAVRAATQVWARAVREHVEPALSEAFGEAFLDAMRRADYSPLPFQLAYLEQVHDRLRIWPDGAFEELRPELLEMLSEGMSIDEVQDRIGRLLDIDAPTRRLRAEISEVDRQLTDPDLSRENRRALRSRRAALWRQHDESLGEWQYLARRIARTEIHGAVEGGSLAAAQAAAQATGQTRYKRWLATGDHRVRATHAIADGQIVELGEAFTVGRAELQHPGEAGGPAREVIQCRCTMLILERDEVDAALEGEWGGRGIGPGYVRIGPDDPDDADLAVRRWTAEQRGEPFDEPTQDDDVEPEHPDPDPVADDHVAPPPGFYDEPVQPEGDGIDIVIDDEEDPDAILGRETHDLLDQARADLPADEAAWDALAEDYRPDAAGNLLPSQDLDAALDRVMEAGAAVWSDIAAAMDADNDLRHARQDLDQANNGFDYSARVQARRAVARREAELIRDALGEYRVLGGHEQEVTRTRTPDAYQSTEDPVRQADTRIVEDLRAAEQVFPREWLEAADQRGALVLGQVDRAFFVDGGGGQGRDMIAGNSPGMPLYNGAFDRYQQEVMAHELAHRMEQAVPGLMQLEFALVRRRAMDGDKLEEPSLLYPGSNEYALADQWLNGYAGKHYAPAGYLTPARVAHEVFQVGIQDLMGRSSTVYGDVAGGQLTAFMLGVILLLWPGASAAAATTTTTATATAAG